MLRVRLRVLGCAAIFGALACALACIGTAKRRAPLILGSRSVDALLPAEPGAGAPPRIARLEGEVSYQSSGSLKWQRAVLKKKIRTGDALKTGVDGTVVIAFPDKSQIRIHNESKFGLERYNRREAVVRFGMGLIEGWLRRQQPRRFRVVTPSAVATVRGTNFQFQVDVSTHGHSTWDLFEGILEIVDNARLSTTLVAGQRLVVHYELGAVAVLKIPLDLRMTLPVDVESYGRKAAPLPPRPKRDPAVILDLLSDKALELSPAPGKGTGMNGDSGMDTDFGDLAAPEPPEILLKGFDDFFERFKPEDAKK